MINLEKKALLVNRQIPHNLKSQLEQDYLPAYLVQRRWFAGKNQKCPELKITDVFPTSVDGGPILMVFETVGDRPQSYFMPIGFKHTAIKPAVVICEIKLGSLLGYLVDALEDDELLQQLVSNLRVQPTTAVRSISGYALSVTPVSHRKASGLLSVSVPSNPTRQSGSAT